MKKLIIGAVTVLALSIGYFCATSCCEPSSCCKGKTECTVPNKSAETNLKAMK